MHLYLGPDISQAFWRLVYPDGRSPNASPHPPAPHDQCACSSTDIFSLAPQWVARCQEGGCEVVDAIVFDKSSTRASTNSKTTVWSGPILPGSFCPYRQNVSVSSPSFTFLQLAARLSLPELIAYGNELCGYYAFAASEPRGMRQRETPLATAEVLARYLSGADGAPGVKNARRAVRHIVDGSASPMETLDEMLLCLPYKQGGYGLRAPIMNYAISLGERAAQIAMRQVCRGDLCWPELKLIIEHQGQYDHDNKESFSADRSRINGLKAQGFEIIELTGGIVHNLEALEEIALHIAKLRGKRVPAYALGATTARLALRETLFSWNARSGRPA